MARFSRNRNHIILFGKRLPVWVVAIEAIFIVGALILAPFALLARPNTGPGVDVTPTATSGTPIPTPTNTAQPRSPTPTTPSGGAVSNSGTPTATPSSPTAGATPPPVLTGDSITVRDWRWQQTGERLDVSGTVVNRQGGAEGPIEAHVSLIDCTTGEVLHTDWESTTPQVIPAGATATFEVSIGGGILTAVEEWDAVRFNIRTWRGEIARSTFGCVGGKPASGRSHSWTTADELAEPRPQPTTQPTFEPLLTPTPTATPAFGPTPTPSTAPPTAGATLTPTPSAGPTAAATPAGSPSPTADPSPTPTTPATAAPTPSPTPAGAPTPTPTSSSGSAPQDGVHVTQWQWDQAGNAVVVSGQIRNFGDSTESNLEVRVTLFDCIAAENRYANAETPSPTSSVPPGQTASFEVRLDPQNFRVWEPWDGVRITVATFFGTRTLSSTSSDCAQGQPPQGQPQSP